MVKLVLDGYLDGRRVRFPLDPGRCRVGRAPRNDIVLAEMSVSREQAEITVLEDGVEIRDLGSTNGTLVDGRRVLDTIEIRTGQTIRFGAPGVEFRLVEDPVADWSSALPLARLSANEAVRIQRVGVPSTLQFFREGDAEPAIETDAVAAMSDAGHLLVLPNTPVDAVAEIIDLTRRIIAWQRAAVLVSSTIESRPALLYERGPQEQAEADLLLSRESWGALSRDRLPLLIEPSPARPESGEGQSEHQVAPARALALPILERGKSVGALYFEFTGAMPVVSLARFKALALFTDLLSARLSQARVSDALRDRERLGREVSLAARVQQRMLSNTRIEEGDYEALARQIPCYEVGGDLYDISVRADGSIILVVGDATGKGMGAALLMSNVMAAFRALSPEILDPGELASRLHQQLLCFTETWQFVTLFLGVLSPSEHRLEDANAGHCAPLLMPAEGPPRSLVSNGFPLGAIPDASYRSETVWMSPEALLCVYSDGVTEASCAGDFYGEERLLGTLQSSRSLPPAELVDQVVRDVRGFVQDQPIEDDITLMVLRRRASR